MKTKIAKIEVTTCLLCPFFDSKYDYCKFNEVSFNPLSTYNIKMNDNIPTFCKLQDKE